MILNCMIVDDEPVARDILKNYIARSPGLNLVKTCISAMEAYEGLHEFKVDLVFLDIQMPVITGMEFLRSLRNPPAVIFTTAYSNFALEGYELNVVDYLLKPITFERFYQSVQKLAERIANKEQPGEPSKQLADYTFIKQDSKLIRINYNEIEYILAERDFSSIYFVGGKKILAGMHLKLFEELLPGKWFIRVHRSYIVNLKKIKVIKGNIIEIGNSEIPIGANYKDDLFAMLQLMP